MPPVNARRWRWEDAGFEASLSYVVKHCLKAKPSKEDPSLEDPKQR